MNEQTPSGEGLDFVVQNPDPNEGMLQAVVWPTHVGAVNEFGQEPMGDHDYDRSQITWTMNEQGRLVGSGRVNVPRGNWTHLIYTHHPTSPGFITAQKLAHPINLAAAGTIDIIDITDGDVAVLNPEVIHD